MGPNPPIFDEIGKKVIENLKCDEQFSDELIQRIAQLFESGNIADQAKLLGVLQGGLSEDSEPRD